MICRTWFASVVAAGVVSATIAAQTPAPARPSGLVMGVVVDSLNGKPVPSVTVAIGSNAVMSDDEGRFVFADLPKGNYVIDAVKPGYFNGSYGRTRPEGPAATLPLGVDERIGDLRIPIFRCGAISGQVRDETGEPLVGATVEVLARAWIGGRLTLVRTADAVTDDRGAYRVGDLASGDFIVAAIYETLPVLRADGDFVYPVHYFPGAAEVSQALPVSLKVGDDRTEIDISLRLSAAARVSGIVRSATGPVAAPVILAASANGSGGAASVALEAMEVTSEPSGLFSFRAVPSGSYVARSVVQPPPVKVGNALRPERLTWASTPLVVTGDDVSNVEVLLRPGFRIIGQMVFESAARGRGPGYEALRRVTGTIDSFDVDMRALGDAASLSSDTAGFLLSKELPPGRYFIRLDNIPSGWSLKRISLRGRDLSNAPISLDGDISGLTFTFTERPVELSGYVRGNDGVTEGATVLVFPRDRATWTDFGRTPLGLRAARSSRDGSFRFAGLPPGDYLVIAVDDASAVDWQQAKRLEALAQAAMAVTLDDGEKRSIELRPLVVR